MTLDSSHLYYNRAHQIHTPTLSPTPNPTPLTPQFYAHFKQANEGDVKGDRPGAFNFTAKYKYDAWKKLEGLSKEDAQKKYVELLEAVSEGVVIHLAV